MNNVLLFPALQLPSSRKTKKWRKLCIDFVDSKLLIDYNSIRNSTKRKKINYDLLNGKIHMDDLLSIVNPEGLLAEFITLNIQHYSIINPKLEVLRGEERKRPFDYRVIVTNPTAISDIENKKKDALMQDLQLLILDDSVDEELFKEKSLKLNDYYVYEWQDEREVRGNWLLNHYSKEYNMPVIFNSGFMDAMTVGEEIYQCDIVGGEPIIERINPLKIDIYKQGYSNKIEDADIIVLRDYWSPGRIYDVFCDVLTKKDVEYLENIADRFSQGNVDSMDNIDETAGFVNINMIDDILPNSLPDSTVFFDPLGEYSNEANDLAPCDSNGNIRVMRVYWKSRRKIKKIKFYDPETGEEDFTFMPESYIPNEAQGEEETALWVNEAWEGTKIGLEIYVNIRPRPVQYNKLNNPSRCHFGIVGSIYNLNDSKPHSMVDMMKPYSYLYDVIHDRLNKLMARNWGKMTRLDLSKKPAAWDMNKWLYYAKTMGLFVEDSFNEGMSGQALGKIAGGLNSNTQGVIDADFGNNIQLYINLLEFIKAEMAEAAGISKQREGQVSNRETVGGVERATLQSSHITEWVFSIHNDVKKRTLEVFLETAKAALRGRNKKFQYLLSDNALGIMDIDGEDFAECDYGLVVDDSNDIQDLNQKIESLALAALLTLTLSFSTILKLFTSCSLAEKQKFVEIDEKRMREEAQQSQQQLMQLQQQQAQMQMQNLKEERQFKDSINQRDNDTRLKVAQINSEAELAILQLKNNMTKQDVLELLIGKDYANKEKLMHEMQIMDKKFLIEREKMKQQLEQFNKNLQFLRDKQESDADLKRMQINKRLSK